MQQKIRKKKLNKIVFGYWKMKSKREKEQKTEVTKKKEEKVQKQREGERERKYLPEANRVHQR